MATEMLFEVRHPTTNEYITECPRCAGHEIKASSVKKLTVLATAHASQVHDVHELRWRNARSR